MALLIVVIGPGELRWVTRFIKGQPRRGPIAAFFAILILTAIARAVS